MIPETEVFSACDPAWKHCNGASDVAIIKGTLHVETQTVKHLSSGLDVSTVKEVKVVPLNPSNTSASISPGSLGSKEKFFFGQRVASSFVEFSFYVEKSLAEFFFIRVAVSTLFGDEELFDEVNCHLHDVSL